MTAYVNPGPHVSNFPRLCVEISHTITVQRKFTQKKKMCEKSFSYQGSKATLDFGEWGEKFLAGKVM